MRNREIQILVRLNPVEHRHLKKQAANAGLKVAPFVRFLIMGKEIRPRPPDTFAALLRELSAIGNNINQIAHIANAQKGINADEINAAAELVRRAWRLVRDTL